MGTGYTRNDTANNIADGNVINAADLDGEFDAVQSAFNASSGHSHDGTTGEGPQIDASGIANNAVALGTKTTGNYVAAGAVAGTGLSGSASAEGATFTVTSNATNLNTGSTIVARDSSGNFTAGTITASLTGNVTGNVSGTAGSTTGNAATATALQTARNIGGVSFDGTGNIDLPGVNTGGNQSTSGNAATATALASARTIGGVSFDGTGNIDLPGVNTGGNQSTSGNAATATALETARNIHGVSFDGTGNIDLSEVIQDTVGAMFTGNTETNITATYEDSDGTIDLVVAAPGIASLADDSSPQLGAGLDLNSQDITGTGNINNTGTVTTDGLTVAGNTDISSGTIKLNGDFPTGTENTALGLNALSSVEAGGARNICIGHSAGETITTLDDNVFIGHEAGQSINASDNVGIGSNTLNKGGGSSNTVIGVNAMLGGSSGAYNAHSNVAVGYQALKDSLGGDRNVAVGYSALESIGSSSDGNTAVGYEASRAGGGTESVAVGYQALEDFVGSSYNVAVGYQALQGNSSFTVDGSRNVAVGHTALKNCRTGQYNVGIGYEVMKDNTTGNNNTAIGYQAGLGLNTTTSDSNTLIGYQAGDSITSGSNITCLGNDADASAVDATNEITLGNSSVATLRCQVQTISSLSDERDKENIQPLDAGIEFVKGLKPVSFDWNMRDGGKVGISDTGFIAQDLQQVQKETGVDIPYLVLDNNPDKLEAGYGKLLPVLVKAIQEQQKTIEELEARVTTLQKDLA